MAKDKFTVGAKSIEIKICERTPKDLQRDEKLNHRFTKEINQTLFKRNVSANELPCYYRNLNHTTPVDAISGNLLSAANNILKVFEFAQSQQNKKQKYVFDLNLIDEAIQSLNLAIDQAIIYNRDLKVKSIFCYGNKKEYDKIVEDHKANIIDTLKKFKESFNNI